MAAALNTVPDRSDVLIDANIFIYGITGNSAQCKGFLERCSREEVTGISIYEVLHDATHQFMLGEGRQKGLFTRKGVTYLSEHPEQVKLLSDYWQNTLRLLALNILFLPMEDDIERKAQTERVNAGLLTNDSIIVATMREYGLTHIASNDGIFDSVAGLTVFSPTDLP